MSSVGAATPSNQNVANETDASSDSAANDSAAFNDALSEAVTGGGLIIGGQLMNKMMEKDQDAPEA